MDKVTDYVVNKVCFYSGTQRDIYVPRGLVDIAKRRGGWISVQQVTRNMTQNECKCSSVSANNNYCDEIRENIHGEGSVIVSRLSSLQTTENFNTTCPEFTLTLTDLWFGVKCPRRHEQAERRRTLLQRTVAEIKFVHLFSSSSDS